MSYKALYRTYRPNTFDEVVGQKHIVRTLKNAVVQNKIAHAYLFCGPRGTGKTSIAKIFAKAVNCIDENKQPCMECENCLAITDGTHPDIIEIDAASNNGVEEVRSLIEKVKYAPIQSRYKVYIIDEVHMMSPGAFNALLKTIEEPPAHVIFILATTEPHKVLPTIISRCQRYDFTKVPADEVIKRIHVALDQEHIQCEEEVIRIISQLCDGGMRDAWSILDQCIAYAQDDIKVHHINEIYGILTVKEKLHLLDMVFEKDAAACMNWLQMQVGKGIDIKRLTTDLIDLLKEALIYEYTKSDDLLKIMQLKEVRTLNEKISLRSRYEMIDILMETYDKYRNAASIASYFEICLLKMMEDNSSAQGETVVTNGRKDNLTVTGEQRTKRPSIPTRNQSDIRLEIRKDSESLNDVDVKRADAGNQTAGVASDGNEVLSQIDKTSNVSRETSESLVANEIKQAPMQEPPQLLDLDDVNDCRDYGDDESIDDDKLPESERRMQAEDAENVSDQMTAVINTPINSEFADHSPKPLQDEYVLQLLVGANKPEKQSDMEQFQQIHRYTMELQWARVANLLKNSKLFASGESYLVLIVNNQAEANEINESDSRNEFVSFSSELLKKQKKIFAITNEQSLRVTDEFRNRRNSGTLPSPIQFQVDVNKEVKASEPSQEDIMIDLFGKENILITEE